jgi:hypothetical protein
MKRLLFFASTNLVLLLGCGEKNNAPQPPIVQGSDTTSIIIGDERVSFSIDSPKDILQTDYLAFEVAHHENNRGGSSFEYSGSKNSNWEGANCWNLLFYNAKTREYYLLDSTKKMLIHSYELNDTAKGKVVRNIARYDIQFDDNQDGKFTDADAKRLFVSSRLGKNFHQVSPENVSVTNYQFSPKENFIILYGLKDTNRDGLFDSKDRTYVYRLDLNQEAEKIISAQMLIPKEFQDKLQKKVETDWQLSKKITSD